MCTNLEKKLIKIKHVNGEQESHACANQTCWDKRLREYIRGLLTPPLSEHYWKTHLDGSVEQKQDACPQSPIRKEQDKIGPGTRHPSSNQASLSTASLKCHQIMTPPKRESIAEGRTPWFVLLVFAYTSWGPSFQHTSLGHRGRENSLCIKIIAWPQPSKMA